LGQKTRGGVEKASARRSKRKKGGGRVGDSPKTELYWFKVPVPMGTSEGGKREKKKTVERRTQKEVIT